VGELDGRVALVTGGALGIGRGIARGMSAAGAAVVVADVDGEAATALVDELSAGGSPVLATVGDVSDRGDVRRMVGEAVAWRGRLDILVNNAGILPTTWYHRVEDMPDEVWDQILAVNLTGTFLVSRAAIPAIRAAGGGSIINLSSVQGLQSMPRVGAYGATKAGILSLTRTMALEYARERIRVNAICPGTIDSELVRGLARAEGGDLDATLARYGSVDPLGRLGLPEDVANAAVFLASDRASFITGEFRTVDGGLMAQGAWATSAGAGD
jgi:NAD(P)-dependent dehydrogenase (short-subunit alcohol dehydrogenase family)